MSLLYRFVNFFFYSNLDRAVIDVVVGVVREVKNVYFDPLIKIVLIDVECYKLTNNTHFSHVIKI